MVMLYTILTLAVKGAEQGHIHYGIDVNSNQLETALSLLISKGLLSKEGDRYRTTAKGLTFIEQFEKIQTRIEARVKENRE